MYRMTHKKENKVLIQKEHEDIQTEIRNLENSPICKTIEVESTFISTMKPALIWIFFFSCIDKSY